ncbi:hypothetical protein PR048_026361 [Dryococelus australis]|uniref:Uncharacterized protein n=1 Tax=Dryococelus australis TaxID=614101 RepID=A0ABQ9GL34_9NEOP|nr:hypothetical protein PR048_026361 [Dryococelus australis]
MNSGVVCTSGADWKPQNACFCWLPAHSVWFDALSEVYKACRDSKCSTVNPFGSLLQYAGHYYVELLWGRGVTEAKALASHHGEMGSITGTWESCQKNATGRRVFSGIFLFPLPLHSGAAPHSSHPFSGLRCQEPPKAADFTHHSMALRISRREMGNERLACSPPTKANRVQCSAGSLPEIFARGNRAGRCRWSAGFLDDLPFLPPFHSGAATSSPRFTLIGSSDLAVKNRPNLFTHSPCGASGQQAVNGDVSTVDQQGSPGAADFTAITRDGRRSIVEVTPDRKLVGRQVLEVRSR